MLKPIVLYLFYFFFLSGISFAQGVGVDFLRLGVGARAVGMGEGFIGLANDVNACWWNPAGLTQLVSREISTTHLELFGEARYEYLGAGFPIGEDKAIGLGLSGLWTDEMPTYEFDEATGRPKAGNLFRAYNGMVSLSYAERLSDFFSLGVNFKFILEKIKEDQGEAYALDMGILYNIWEQLSIGMVVQNLGTQMRVWRDSFPLPLTLKAGIAYKLAEGVSENTGFMLTSDLGWEWGSSPDFRLGTEYWLGNFLVFRAGYKYVKENEGIVGLTTGGGFRLGNLQLDYAYVPLGEIGDTHRVSLTVQF